MLRHPSKPAAARSRGRRPIDFGLGPLFVHTRDSVVVGNLDTRRVVLCNAAAERLLGWTAAEASGQPIDRLAVNLEIESLHAAGAIHHQLDGDAL